MTRKELIAEADRLTNQIEEANLEEAYFPALGLAVKNFEWLVYFEGHPSAPTNLPANGAEAHARLMDALEYVLSGQVVREEYKGANREIN